MTLQAQGTEDQFKHRKDAGNVIQSGITTGWTALIWTSYLGHLEVMKLLLEKVADPGLKDKDNVTALGWALLNTDGEVLELVKAHGAKE